MTVAMRGFELTVGAVAAIAVIVIAAMVLLVVLSLLADRQYRQYIACRILGHRWTNDGWNKRQRDQLGPWERWHTCSRCYDGVHEKAYGPERPPLNVMAKLPARPE